MSQAVLGQCKTIVFKAFTVVALVGVAVPRFVSAESLDFSTNTELLETIYEYQAELSASAYKRVRTAHRINTCAIFVASLALGIGLTRIGIPHYEIARPIAKIALTTVTAVGFATFFSMSYALFSNAPRYINSVRSEGDRALREQMVVDNVLRDQTRFVQSIQKHLGSMPPAEIKERLQTWLKQKPDANFVRKILLTISERERAQPLLRQKVSLASFSDDDALFVDDELEPVTEIDKLIVGEVVASLLIESAVSQP